MPQKPPKSLLPEALQKEASDFIKGESPMPPGQRLIFEAKQFIMTHTGDLEGALKAILCELIDGAAGHIDAHRDTPATVVLRTLAPLLSNDFSLRDLVRRVDARWGAMNQERPYFDRPGEVPHPEDPYTLEGVSAALIGLQTTAREKNNT